MSKVIVVGGGAAGMLAALSAAQEKADVLLLEKNEKLGKKLYLTGKGRCNVTNHCTLDEFMQEVPHNARFLYSAITAFSPQDMMRLLEDCGCPLQVQRGRRVFPVSEKASDVTRALQAALTQAGAAVRLNTEVESILTQDEQVTGVRLRGGESLSADAVIVCCGGTSYPKTGSTGDGDRFAASLGLRVEPRRASLSAVITEESWPAELQGLSLRNTELTLTHGKKCIYQQTGEMLFTHFGVSGPLVLEASCHLPEEVSECVLTINLKPGLSREILDQRLQRELAATPRRQLGSIMPSLVPARLGEVILSLCGTAAETLCGQVTRKEREEIAAMMQSLTLHIAALRPIEEAIVTRGGVSVKELNPTTMESKKIAGLFFAGEAIDVDAHTGGYNLQIAFSTGRAAGRAAAKTRES